MEYFKTKNKEVYICFGSGEKYLWQYAGCGCYQGEIKNPVFLGVSESRIFNSNWWYKLSHFEGFVIPNFEWKMNFGSTNFEKSHRAQLERANNDRNKITFKQLFEEVIREANILNKKFTDFKLTDENMTDNNEAYVPVSFIYQNKRKNGILIWDNCD